MKSKKLWTGIALIALAVILILDGFGVLAPLTASFGEVSVWAVLGGILLLIHVVRRLCKGHIAEIFVPLALIFMLFEKNIAFLCGAETEDLVNNWLLLLIAFLFDAGFRLIFPRRKRKNHPAVKTQNHTFAHSASYIDSKQMTPDYVENSLGSCDIYFENAEAYVGGGTLTVENNLGAMRIHLPSSMRAEVFVENNLGSIEVPEKKEGAPVYIRGENNLGSLTISYV